MELYKSSINFLIGAHPVDNYLASSSEVHPPVDFQAVADSAPISSELEEIHYILNGAPSIVTVKEPAKWARDVGKAHAGFAKWNLLSAELEPRYVNFARMTIPSYVLPWNLEVCKHKSSNSKASRVLFIQLMIAEVRGLAIVNRFETPAKGFWGVDRVFVRVDNINAFSSLPIPIPQAGMGIKARKSINCLWNRAGFDIATRCNIDGVPYVFYAFDESILEKSRLSYSRQKRGRDDEPAPSGAAEAATGAKDI